MNNQIENKALNLAIEYFGEDKVVEILHQELIKDLESKKESLSQAAKYQMATLIASLGLCQAATILESQSDDTSESLEYIAAFQAVLNTTLAVSEALTPFVDGPLSGTAKRLDEKARELAINTIKSTEEARNAIQKLSE
ncbi:hypothetical protein [Vibrio harveyi]|uniref:hypothetical protein n=1 Tax=Vibrio harveyi TaxID=669 RepID=UPI00040B6456|nr:hypothetical protein [Vibrio harveyi]